MKTKIKIFPDSLPADFWHTLSKAVSNEPLILGTRTTPDALRQLYQQGLAMVMVDSEKLIGFLAAWPVADGFAEIGTAWIHPDLRGQKLCIEMYYHFDQLPGLVDRLVFGITMNPKIISSGLHIGLTCNHDWENPIPWHLTCEPCDKFATESEKRTCSNRNSTCWLRLFKT